MSAFFQTASPWAFDGVSRMLTMAEMALPHVSRTDELNSGLLA
jgi:hypothetical protein